MELVELVVVEVAVVAVLEARLRGRTMKMMRMTIKEVEELVPEGVRCVAEEREHEGLWLVEGQEDAVA